MSKDVVEVHVRGLAAGGAGVADLPDGRVVFVPRTTEGDQARIKIEKSRPRWARAALVTLLDPSPGRVKPPCPLYAECGGCQFQHVAYEDQLTWKGRFVSDALTRIGGFEGVTVSGVVPSPLELHYRNRISYTLRRLPKGYVVAGFHAVNRPAHVVDINRECLLPDERLTDAWMALRERWGWQANLLPSAGRLRLTLRLSGDEGADVDLVVEGGRPGWDGRPLFDAVDALRAIWHVASTRGEAPGDSEDGGSGATLVAGAAADPNGPAFTQVNDQAAASLRAHVLERCGVAAGSSAETPTAIDAYCGAGQYGRALAAEGWAVQGIESDPSAAAQARTDADAASAGSFDVYEGLVEDLLPSRLPADLLVLNPPRSGLHEDVPSHVLERPSSKIVYVSCDPATLARDLKRLTDRYTLNDVRSFDLFPQTAHVETVAELRLRSVSE